jgi:ABC-2 type transport system permease protein
MTEPVRTLRWSTWLGWQIESNWANPWLFVLYLVVKPVTGSLMLVCMYYAARLAAETGAGATLRGAVTPDKLAYMYVSNACFGLVGVVMFGMSYVVISDRESYRMLKYVYISPAKFQAYFLGRGLARMMEGVAGGTITLLAGLSLPDIRGQLDIARVEWGYLLAYLVVGFVMLWAAGMVLASAVLNMSRNSMFLSEGIAGVVYLLSGVVFPLAVLPGPLRAASYCLPTTYWLEGIRRCLLGPTPGQFEGWGHGQILLALACCTAGLVAASQWFYRWSVRRAWRNGKIEETTGN